MRRRLGVLALAAACWLASPSRADTPVPAWLTAAAARPTPAWIGHADALTLVESQEVSVLPDGRVRTESHTAVRLLSAAGLDRAAASLGYTARDSHIDEFRAWHLRKDGRVEALEDKDATDVSLAQGWTLADDTRARLLVARQPAAGDVFGYTSVVEERPFLAHWKWTFQGADPVLESSFAVTAPESCAVAGTVLGDGVVEAADGARRAWTARELHPPPDEDDTPPASALRPWLVARLVAARPGAPTPGGESLVDWRGVSRWYTALSEPVAGVTPALQAHADSVTRGVTDARARTLALAKNVQDTRYVEVALDKLRGGGFRPHDPERVLALGYGDCKDKANLLRALLRAEGLPAWMVLVNASDAAEVRDSTWSPWAFDHCILALPAAATDDPTAVVHHPKLGALILFDPTEPLVPFGDLPMGDRGRLALVVAGDSGCVVRTPDASSARERTERTIEARLDGEGALRGTWAERTTGSRAVTLTDRRQSEGERAVAKQFERMMSAVVGGVSLKPVDGSARFEGTRTEQQFSFEAERAVQNLAADRMLLRVGPLPALTLPSIGAARRTLPVWLDAQALRERWRVALPPGWRAETLPASVRDSTAFGVATTTWTSEDSVIVLERALRTDPAEIPAARWAEVQAFVQVADDDASAGVVITNAARTEPAPAPPAPARTMKPVPARRHRG
jgi:hypothetical protein